MDKFENLTTGLESPATHAFDIVPGDGVDLPHVTRALYVGGAGDVSLVMKDASAATLKNVPAGSVIAVRVARVQATGTSATDIVGFC